MEKINFIEKEDRPWGRFYVIDNQSNYKIKRIEVEPGHQLSYQFHNKRSEAWTIIEGSGGKISDWTGKRLDETSDGAVLASANEKIHEKALKILNN